MSHKATDRIRNVALIGHRGCGKTSLAEALLFEAGAITRLGRTEAGTTVCDFEPDEQERGMSIGSAVCTFEHDDRKLNLIDTPGEPSFVADALGSIAVADGAVVVINAVSGVQVSTERLWRRADAAGLPRLVFVNMLDRERADFFAALEALQSAFGSHVVATEIPIGSEHDVRGVIDLIDMRAFIHEGDGRGGEVEAKIPPELTELAAEFRDKLMDEVAENSDALMERYLEGEEISHSETIVALKKGVAEGRLFPVTCGVATRNLGTERLLQALVEDLPSPQMRGGRVVLDSEGEPVEVLPDPEGELVAEVFKTTADPFTGRLNVLRVLSGTLRCDSHLLNATSGSKERVGQLAEVHGKDMRAVDELRAGDIGVVAKLKSTSAGDVLCADGRRLRSARLDLPAPVMAFAFEAKSKGDEEKAATAIRRLREEDPALDVHRDPLTGEQIIAGLTQMHVEVIVERMRRRFGAEVVLKPPEIPYVETIKHSATAHARYKKQSGGRGQFADCEIEISPAKPGSGLHFENAIRGGVVPASYIPAVEKGVAEAMEHGEVAGYPIKDVHVRLFDGSHHSVDSSEMAFRICASMAFKDAMARAEPALLEPIVRVAISVPDDAVGDVLGDLNSRRGHPLGMEPAGGETRIDAEVPMAEVLDYAPDLRAITGGRGEYTLAFERYDEMPANLAADVVAASRTEPERASH